MFVFQLSKLACDYEKTCVSDSSSCGGGGGEVSGSQCGNVGGGGGGGVESAVSSEVYVWGSNSSHQLAEGNVEKIMQPKLAQQFGPVHQVRINLLVLL